MKLNRMLGMDGDKLRKETLDEWMQQSMLVTTVFYPYLDELNFHKSVYKEEIDGFYIEILRAFRKFSTDELILIIPQERKERWRTYLGGFD